jgi:hypothetical protein
LLVLAVGAPGIERRAILGFGAVDAHLCVTWSGPGGDPNARALTRLDGREPATLRQVAETDDGAGNTSAPAESFETCTQSTSHI